MSFSNKYLILLQRSIDEQVRRVYMTLIFVTRNGRHRCITQQAVAVIVKRCDHCPLLCHQLCPRTVSRHQQDSAKISLTLWVKR